MSEEYIQKIRILLNQSQQTVPYIFERFYTLLKSITLSLKTQNIDHKIFQQYALIFKTVKKYIKDQPFLILNNHQKIQKQLKTLISPLLLYMQNDLISRKIFQYFMQPQIVKYVNSFIQKSQKIKQQLTSKNNKIKVYGTHQLSNAFWINKFKTQYAVHFDIFWNNFIDFIKQINFFQYFICDSLKRSINKRIDPQKKYYVTSSNVSTFFYKLSQPQFLQMLADQTAKAPKLNSFISKDFIQMTFHKNNDSIFDTNLIQNEDFQINGQDVYISGNSKKCKYPPTIIFGSGVDSDIKIKNKYVSRKQFMIIEQENNMNQNRLNFSLVCLSSSNFTMVSYGRIYQLNKGVIFKIGQSAIQIVNQIIVNKQNQLWNKQIQQDNQEQQDDETLQYLPNKQTKNNIINNLYSNNYIDKGLQYIVLTGKHKGHTGKIQKQKLLLTFDDNSIQIEQINNKFYLPKNTSIYVKTANQVINGHLSDKIQLQPNMKILLEECQFRIK